MSFFKSNLSDVDKDIAETVNNELIRQQSQIELIASENIVSKAVLDAQGSIHTNKYAEGYPDNLRHIYLYELILVHPVLLWKQYFQMLLILSDFVAWLTRY